MSNRAEQLVELAKNQKVVFVKTDPEIGDCTSNIELVVFGNGKKRKIDFKEEINQCFGTLQASIFGEGATVICWNIKQFFSFARHKTGKAFRHKAKLIDLKVKESYLGINEKCPENWTEAFQRCLRLRENQSEKSKKIYEQIHLSLIESVIPDLENVGILDLEAQKKLYAYYDIEGQANGRLKCILPSERNYNPHSLGPKEREKYRPVGEDHWFLCFDFNHMEVAILQWLSGDVRMGQLLGLEGDFYKKLFKAITGKPCDDLKFRKFAKDCFFPVIFGSSAGGLAKNLEISVNFAEFVVNRLNSMFPTAMSFVQDHQDKIESNIADCFGRIRIFDEQDHYKIRNFIIQSPAATICLEKLIKLYNYLKKEDPALGFHVHDGYGLFVQESKYRILQKQIKEVLESPSDLAPDLELKVSCKIGPTLNELISL
jgi:hypothetical protein